MAKVCKWCGKVNPDDALTCGEGQWDGCGATLLTIELDTSCTLQLPHETMGVRPHLPPRPTIRQGTLHTYRRPGKTARQFQRDVEAMKTEIGLALLPALEAALRQWGGR